MIGNERFLSTLTFDESDDEGAALTKTQAQQKREDFERDRKFATLGSHSHFAVDYKSLRNFGRHGPSPPQSCSANLVIAPSEPDARYPGTFF
mmetsp:Transcript_10564/g.21109  ORF Transcript_10564/g.21109 Transcript_10564/m.21109 type:complete len:92 (-) Transcript_10564:42-317(-)